MTTNQMTIAGLTGKDEENEEEIERETMTFVTSVLQFRGSLWIVWSLGFPMSAIALLSDSFSPARPTTAAAFDVVQALQ